MSRGRIVAAGHGHRRARGNPARAKPPSFRSSSAARQPPIATRAVFPASKARRDGERRRRQHRAARARAARAASRCRPRERPEMARVDAELLDQLLNISGEASIARARLEQQMGSIDFNLGELVAHGHAPEGAAAQARDRDRGADPASARGREPAHRSDFDPLELDRYSSIQQFSRALAETANDVRQHPEPARERSPRTRRTCCSSRRAPSPSCRTASCARAWCRSSATCSASRASCARPPRTPASAPSWSSRAPPASSTARCSSACCRRSSTCCATPSCTASRSRTSASAAGKPDAGRIMLELHREGAEVMVRLSDDGAGMNLKAIRDKGAALGPDPRRLDAQRRRRHAAHPRAGLLDRRQDHAAGRPRRRHGRGGDRDQAPRRRAPHGDAAPGRARTFTIRLPFTLAISHALVVRTGDEFYALPLPTVEGVLRLSKTEVTSHLGRDQRHLRLQRPEVPLPESRHVRRPRAVAAAGAGRDDSGRAGARRRAFDRPHRRRARGQPRNRREERRAADLGDPRHLGRDDSRRRPHRRHSRHRRAGARRVARHARSRSQREKTDRRTFAWWWTTRSRCAA